MADVPDTEALAAAERAAVLEEGGEQLQTLGPDGVQGLSWWCPYGEGWSIPFDFVYDGGAEHLEWEVHVRVVGGQPRCIGLRCRGFPEIDRKMIQRFPLTRLVEEAVLMVGRPAEEIPRRSTRWDSLEEARRTQVAVLSRYRRQLRGSHPPVVNGERLERLQEVARIYRAAIANGERAPSVTVARELHYSDSHARRLVSEARKHGYLGPTRPGRRGEDQTQEESNG